MSTGTRTAPGAKGAADSVVPPEDVVEALDSDISFKRH